MKDVWKTVTEKSRGITVMVTAIMLMLIASCYSDDSFNDKENTDGKVTLHPVISTGLQPIISTRGTITVNNSTGTYSDSYLGNGTEIRVYAVPVPSDAQEFDFNELKAGGTFRHNNDQWRSSVAVTADNDYRLFGFAASAYRNEADPTASWLLPGASNQTFNWGLTDPTQDYSAENFSMDNVAVNFTNLDVLTTADPLVCIASSFQKYNTLNPQESVPVSAPQLTKGEFQIARTEVVADGSNDILFRVWMALDHLLSKATVSFCVDADYADIRDIRLKEAKIVIDKSKRSFRGSHSYSFKDGFIPDQNAEFGNISDENQDDLEIYLLGPDSPAGLFDQDKDYKTLTTEYTDFPSFCFLPPSYIPDDGNPLTPQVEYPDVKLKVTYDVFKKGTDNAVRRSQTAENRFPLTSFKIGASDPITPKPGDHFKIRVKVKPTYLYQLHDDDGQIEISIE